MFESSHSDNTYSTSSNIIHNHHHSSHNEQSSLVSRSPTSSPLFQTEHNTPLRHSANSRMLHRDNDVILTANFSNQEFHQPIKRKITKVAPSMFDKNKT